MMPVKSQLARAAVSVTPTVGVVGGLDPAAWPFWQNNAATAFGSFAANGPNGTTDAWITTWNNCTDGDAKPTFTISAQNVWEFMVMDSRGTDGYEIAA